MGCGQSSYEPVISRPPPVPSSSLVVPPARQQIPQPPVHIQQQSASMPIPQSYSSSILQNPKENKMPEITEDMVKNFQALTVVIAALEQKNILGKLEAESLRQAELQKEITALNQHYTELDAQTKKEHADVSNLKAIAQSASISRYFASQHDFEQQFSKEEEEFVQAKTEQENCYQRLIKLQELNSKLSIKIDELRKDKDELFAHYAKQDKFLEDIFGGQYGSSFEDKLEEELDKLEDKHSKIRIALEKWKNAEALVGAAVDQLKFSCKRWFDVQRIPNKGSYQIVRIQAISETRNYLIASSRNLANAQHYLHPIKLPYCDASEVATLNKAITFIFIDGTTRDRHHHAMQVYQTTNARAIMLQKWIGNVLNERISRDLSVIREKCIEGRAALRRERLRLMKFKVEESTGKILDFNDYLASGASVDRDAEETVTLSGVAEADKVEDAQDLDDQIQLAKSENDDADEDPTAALALSAKESEEASKTPLDELAPAPTRNELFGDLDSIMAAYDLQKQAHHSEQQEARAKQEAAIQAKLRKRRSKINRLQSQE